MGFRGFTRQNQRNGAWFERLAIGHDDAPVFPPLHIGPSAAPTTTAAEGDIYLGTDGILRVHNGTSFMAASAGGPVEVVTAANVITAAESGTTFFLSKADGVASTLPAPAAGLRFKFINALLLTSVGHTITTASNATIIQGSVLAAGVVVVGVAEDTITFVHTADSLGDWVEVISDGTSWFVTGEAAVTGGLTLTDAA